MPNNSNLVDAALIQTAALPGAASSSTYTPALDLLTDGTGDFMAEVEFIAGAPALNTTQLPDTKTVTYVVQTAIDAAFTSPVNGETLGVQTGAGGVGAAAAQWRFKQPVETLRYLRVAGSTGSGTGNCSAASMTLTPVF